MHKLITLTCPNETGISTFCLDLNKLICLFYAKMAKLIFWS